MLSEMTDQILTRFFFQQILAQQTSHTFCHAPIRYGRGTKESVYLVTEDDIEVKNVFKFFNDLFSCLAIQKETSKSVLYWPRIGELYQYISRYFNFIFWSGVEWYFLIYIIAPHEKLESAAWCTWIGAVDNTSGDFVVLVTTTYPHRFAFVDVKSPVGHFGDRKSISMVSPDTQKLSLTQWQRVRPRRILDWLWSRKTVWSVSRGET